MARKIYGAASKPGADTTPRIAGCIAPSTSSRPNSGGHRYSRNVSVTPNVRGAVHPTSYILLFGLSSSAGVA
jgi:hypothetical protein